MTNSFGSQFSSWWQSLGIVAGASSLISFVQKVFDVGLAGVFATFVEFYRSIFYPLLSPLFSLLQALAPFDLPDWYKDTYLLSFILCLPYFRERIVEMAAEERDPMSPVGFAMLQTLFAVAFSAISSLFLYGFVVLLFAVLLRFEFGWDHVADYTEHAELYGELSQSLLAMSAATVAFFVLNWQFQ